MKAISQGDNTYDIFDDSLKVYDQLPSQAYVVRFSERRGFYLERYCNINISESKIYGTHDSKVEKVLRSFSQMNRSLGVILSGEKGTGKSLFAKLLASKVINQCMPVIIIDSYIPGIASYIESIEQEAMILFDEFDKTFGEIKTPEGQTSPQSSLLSLFDGLSGGKKLYVITCNNLNKLSEYFINRPGRFHYHLRFGYPSSDEIRQYLKDKLIPEYYEEIESVVEFASKIDLNYDCLRSIAFELNHGILFSEAIKDLNIIHLEKESYKLILQYTNGESISNKNRELDMFELEESISVYMYSASDDYVAIISFIPGNAVYDYKIGGYIVPGDKIRITYDGDEDTNEKFKQYTPKQLLIMKKKAKNLHYVL